MFTVILLSDFARGQLERWNDLFSEFTKRGDVAFCDWHAGSSSRDLAHTAPGLASLVRGKSEWRALVVGNGAEGLPGSAVCQPDNPFDFVDVSSGSADAADAGMPALLHLLYLMLGYPELGIEEFTEESTFILSPHRRELLAASASAQPGEQPAGVEASEPIVDEVLRQLGGQGERVTQVDFVAELVSRGVPEEVARETFILERQQGNDPQVHFRECPPNPEAVERHGRMSARYEVRQVRPQSVLMVAARPALPASPVADLKRAWEQAAVRGSSRFVYRNRYPDSCRFVVYENDLEERSTDELDELRFWLCVLSLAVNEVPASGLQAERLYRVRVEVDEDRLAETVNENVSRLSALEDHITGQSREPQVAVGDGLAKLRERVPVVMPTEDLSGTLTVRVAGYGLAADRPRGELLWNDSLNSLQVATERFTQLPRRVVAQMAADARRQMRVPVATGDETLALTDRLELEDELRERTPRLIQPASRDLLDRTALSSLMERHESRIRRALVRRPSAGTIGLVLAVVLGVWALAFLPALLQAGFIGWPAFTEGLLVLLILIAVLLIGAWLTLVVLRRRFQRLLRNLNSDLRRFVANVVAGGEAYAEWLSELITYMWRRGALVADERRVEREAVEERNREEVRKQARERIVRGQAILKSLDRIMTVTGGRYRHDSFATSRAADLQRQFWWKPGLTSCDFNQSGEKVRAPYDFVTRLQLVDLALREPTITQASDGVETGAPNDARQVHEPHRPGDELVLP